MCKFLQMSSKLRAQVFVNWACNKVECNEPDDVLLIKIREKLASDQGFHLIII